MADKQEKFAIVTCPGGSNVFFLAYKTATRLEKQGYGRFIKLAGEQFKEKDRERLTGACKDFARWFLIEGCSKGCGQKVLDEVGIVPDRHLVISSLGIARVDSIEHTDEELETVYKAALEMIK